jgi:hypothetical protein
LRFLEGARLPFCAAAADTSIFDCSSFIFLMNFQSEGCLLYTDEFHFWWNPTIKYKYNEISIFHSRVMGLHSSN